MHVVPGNELIQLHERTSIDTCSYLGEREAISRDYICAETNLQLEENIQSDCVDPEDGVSSQENIGSFVPSAITLDGFL